MTKIQDIPNETLTLILKDLNPRELRECQTVCKAWYIPALLLYLDRVFLYSETAIRQFIAALDSNPNPLVAKAVRSLNIVTGDDYDSHNFCLDKDLINNLFSRLPNLQEVEFDEVGLLEYFDDRICRTILKNCPQLKRFEVTPSTSDYDEDSPPHYDFDRRARLLVTGLHISKDISKSKYGTLAKYLSIFPRLEEVTTLANCTITLLSMLPVFLEQPKIHTIYLQLREDEDDFMENYLARLSKTKQDLLIKRLSGVQFMELLYEENFCENHLKFVMKYLTGMKKLVIRSYGNNDWEADIWQTAFCTTLLDLIRSAKYQLEVGFDEMDLSDLAHCLPAIMQTRFPPRSATVKSTTKRTLKLATDVDLHFQDSANLEIEENLVTITARAPFVFDALVEELNNSPISACDFDILLLTVDERRIFSEYQMTYEGILGLFSSVKQVIIDIPPDCPDTRLSFKRSLRDCIISSSVEELTVRLQKPEEYQILFNRFSVVLPNIKRLNLNYYCGRWNKHMGEFQTSLPQYSLEILSIDLTPLMMERDEREETYGHQEFFVIEVEYLSNNERHFYKVSFIDLSFAKIDRSDLKGQVVGKDYLRERIIINNLRSLEICMCSQPLIRYMDDGWLSDLLVKKTLIPNVRGSQ